MKRKLYRLFAIVLTMMLLFSADFGQSRVFAEGMNAGVENENDADDPDDPDDPDPGPTPGPVDPDPAPVPGSYAIALDQSAISFGTIHSESPQEVQVVRVKNTGTVPVKIQWQSLDPANAFIIQPPVDLNLPLGGQQAFQFEVRNGLAPGSYKATVRFASNSDLGYARGVTLAVSVTIVPDTPYVTEVDVTPGNVNLSRGGTCQFHAIVQGSNPPQDVMWTLGDVSSRGTAISPDGTLQVGSDEPGDVVMVTATSTADPSKVGKAAVKLSGGETYSVWPMAKPINGGNATGGSGNVKPGGSVTVYAAAENGFIFSGWTLNGEVVCESNSYTITNVRSDMQPVANFRPNTVTVTVKSNHDSRGSVSGGGTIAYGGSVSMKAVPGGGWQFESWCENDKVLSRDLNLTLNNVTSDRVIVAKFTPNQYKVSIFVNPAGAGSFSGNGTYDLNSDINVKAKPNNGYVFDCWIRNGRVFNKNAEFKITHINEDYNLSANFKPVQAAKKTYVIESGVASNNGIISPQGRNSYAEGGNTTYVIAPNKDYRISAVAVDGQMIGPVNSYTFTNIKSNHSIVAAFEPVNPPVSGGNTSPVVNPAPDNTVKKTGDNKGANKDARKQSDDDVHIMDMDTPKEDGKDIIEKTPDLDHLTGLLQILNMQPSEARQLVEAGNDDDLLRLAYENDYLKVTVNNTYADDTQETASDTYKHNPSIPNFGDVLKAIMTEEEKLKILEGDPLMLNINIARYDEYISKADKENIEQVRKEDKDLKIGEYFDVILMKTQDNESQLVTELPIEMELVMKIPGHLQAEGREFYVIRTHDNGDGTIEGGILKDTDSDGNTITVRTDKFSAYALCYRDTGAGTAKESTSNLKQKEEILAVIVLIMVAAVFIVVFFLVSKARRHRKHRR